MVRLDLPTPCDMRAPSAAPAVYALESAMDELAVALRMDPVELRLRNHADRDPHEDKPFASKMLAACYRHGAEAFGWARRSAEPRSMRDGNSLIGWGMATATYPTNRSKASVRVRLNADGSVVVQSGTQDIGTGTYTILTQIAAEMLGLPLDHVRVELGDTAFPEAAGSGGSFGAASSGSALFEACQRLREKLAQLANMDAASARFADGRIASGENAIKLTDLVGAGIEADGEIRPGNTAKDFSQQSYGAHFAEVGVDEDTGEVRLRRMLGVFTAGRVLNAKTARSQAIGGMVFGVGAALHEDLVLDPRFGCFVNHDLAEYHVPVHADIPAIDAVFLPELDDKSNPLKSKGIGELGICGAGAAVANAIHNACGVRIRDYPITLDKILSGLPQRA
jgi:xanthine dehydrogenase YagR molybdenum-binding subunit